MAPELLLALNIFLLITPGWTFLLDAPLSCMANPPCTCSGYDVLCDSKILTTFPTFRVTNVTKTYLYLHLQNNQLTTVPNNAFTNLGLSGTRVYLDLYNNQINSIADNAFVGIANAIVRLKLQSNKLSQIPTALTLLTNLKYLYLTNNPITTLSSSNDTLYSLRNNLRLLQISLQGFVPPWPVELNILDSLTDLYISNLNMAHIDNTTLQAFENKLTTLSIVYSQLESISAAVCNMKNLRSIRFSYNNVPTNSTIYKPCNPYLTQVFQIILQGNNLRYMPDMFYSFPSLKSLYVSNNNISHIDTNLVPGNSSIDYLDMSTNAFTSVPSAIRKLTNLKTLSVYFNNITSIQDSDFDTLTRLQNLYFSDNPLDYISPQAFRNNHALSYVDLQNTRLHQLPTSVAALTNLHYLYLDHVPIQCNCSLSFMKSANWSQLHVSGKCEGDSTPIQTYLTSDLAKCP